MVELSENTKVSLKSALPVMVTVVAATLWITAKINASNTAQEVAAVRQENLRDSLAELKEDVTELRQAVMLDRWSQGDMEKWIRQMRTLNPTLSIPSTE